MSTAEASRRRVRRERRSSVIHLAIIHGDDGVRFAAAAASPSALIQRVLNHISPCVADRLWPADAKRFHGLVEAGDPRAAIELYFRTVGERWDSERLWTGTAQEDDERR